MKFSNLFCLLFTSFVIADVKQPKEMLKTAKVTPKTDAAAKQQMQEIMNKVIAKVDGKNILMKDVWPLFQQIFGKDIQSLSQENQLKYFAMFINSYIANMLMQVFAKEQKYDTDPKFTQRYEAAKDKVSLEIYYENKEKSFSDAELKQEFKAFQEKNKKLEDFKFNIIVVASQKKAEAIIASLENKIAFEKLVASESEGLRFADEKTGLVEFIREDYVAREFGQDCVLALKGSNSAAPLVKAPVAIGNGKFAVIKLVARKPSKPLAFEEVKHMLVQQLFSKYLDDLVKKAIESGRVEFMKN